MFKLIAKLFGFGFKSFAFLSTTLVLSELVLLLALFGKGFLTAEKWERVQAVYTDVDYQAIRLNLIEKNFKAQQDPQRLASTEMLRTRSSSINQLAGEVALSEVRLREAGRRFELVEASFANSVKDLEAKILQSTRQQLSDTLKNMDAGQIKDSLVGLVQDGGLEDVVGILKGMSTSERGKVLAEFQTDVEKQLMNQILQEIRDYQ